MEIRGVPGASFGPGSVEYSDSILQQKLNDKVFLLNVILENLASQLDGLVGDSSVIAAKKCSAPTKLTD